MADDFTSTDIIYNFCAHTRINYAGSRVVGANTMKYLLSHKFTFGLNRIYQIWTICFISRYRSFTSSLIFDAGKSPTVHKDVQIFRHVVSDSFAAICILIQISGDSGSIDGIFYLRAGPSITTNVKNGQEFPTTTPSEREKCILSTNQVNLIPIYLSHDLTHKNFPLQLRFPHQSHFFLFTSVSLLSISAHVQIQFFSQISLP